MKFVVILLHFLKHKTCSPCKQAVLFCLILCLLEGSSGGGVSGGGVSRPLGSDDLRLIEEDLSKQLNAEMMDRDLELDAEPYVTSLENGGEYRKIMFD